MKNEDENISEEQSNLSLSHLPDEILQCILEYTLEVPSLSSLSQTSKINLPLSKLASEDVVWSILIKRRFNIDAKSTPGVSPKPKSYGGTTWKAAYRSLSYTHRIPKCRFTAKRKVVFAKPLSNRDEKKNQTDSPVLKKEESGCEEITDEICPGVSLWVMVSHTENCHTRQGGAMMIVQPGNRRRRMRSFDEEERNDWDDGLEEVDVEDDFESMSYWRRYLPSSPPHQQQRGDMDTTQRYIKLHLCVQNTRTSHGAVHVDFRNAYVQLVDENHSYVQNVKVVTHGPHQPKLLFRKKHNDETEETKMNPRHIRKHVLKLDPLDYVIVAVNVPCPSDVIYETDFLTRAMFMRMPVTMTRQIRLMDQNEIMITEEKQCSNNCDDDGDKGYGNGVMKDGKDHDLSSNDNTVLWTKISYPALASATFLSDKEIWKYYTELPGGCLTLMDASRPTFG